ncbi:predicted protein, partial [Arabidopsis lyrata subsp. lyrata]
GNKIQAGIKKEHISKFQRYVKNGDWKIIEEFSVNKATGTYRSTTHSYRINFHYATVFSPSPSISNEVWLDLVDFTTILSGNLDQNKLIKILLLIFNLLWFRLPSDGLALTIMGPKPRFEPLKVREQRSLGLPLKTIAELKASYEKLLSDGAKKILNRCEKCNAEVSAVEARYWLHLDVMDNTGETKLMLFDSFVEKIIGTPAYELLEGTDEAELDDPLPPPDVLMLTNNSDKEGTSNDVFSTPSSKRKEDFSDGSDQNSTSKKQCMEKQSDVKVDGVIDVENPKEHDLPKFINKLDEAGEQVITKASEEEQKKVLLKKIKVEKIEGQNGAK